MPKGYLNYLLFDKEHNLLDAGFQAVTAAAEENGSNENHEQLSMETTVEEDGYMYIYLSNENDKIADVWFDDLGVTTTTLQVLQENHFYPFGMPMQGVAVNTPKPISSDKNIYNGGSELQDELGEARYSTFFREYDASMGRFMAIDPMASSFTSWSPYNYAYNDPVYWNDPKGDYGRSGSVNDEMQLRNTHMFHYHKDGSAGFGNAGNGGGSGGGSAGGSGVGGSGGNGTLTYDFYTILNDDVFSEEQYVVLPGATVWAIENGNPYRGWGNTNYWLDQEERAIVPGQFTGSMADGSTYFEGVRVYTTEAGDIGRGAAGTVPGVGIFVNPNPNAKYDINLLRHEFGHILQARQWGNDFFYGNIVPVSLMSADAANAGNFNHQSTWTEWTANLLSWRYFGKPDDWEMNDYPIFPVESLGMLSYPPKSINLKR